MNTMHPECTIPSCHQKARTRLLVAFSSGHGPTESTEAWNLCEGHARSTRRAFEAGNMGDNTFLIEDGPL